MIESQREALAVRFRSMARIFDQVEKRSQQGHPYQHMFHSEWKELERLMLECSRLLDSTMSKDTATVDEPIWDSRNSDEPQ
jgi:hypothetical protein